MRNLAIKLCTILPLLAVAAPAPPLSQLPPVIPLKQELVAVNYFTDGRQSGCGLRATGEPEEYLWLNVLVSVYLKEKGQTFGIFKVSAKNISVKNGKPQLKNGRLSYTSIGKIYKGWLRTRSGTQTMIEESRELLHFDGYMASMRFADTMDLLVAISQESFKVGIKRNKDDPEEIFEFNKQINSNEASKLIACMKNLKDEIDEKRIQKKS